MMQGADSCLYLETTEYGCLYDVDIKLSACSSRILDVVGELGLSR